MTNGIDRIIATPGTTNRAPGRVFASRSASQPPDIIPTIAEANVTSPRVAPASCCGNPRVLKR